jgi:hypothetical protein
MTLARFVTKNAFRNKRRSILTMLSIAFSLLLLTFMLNPRSRDNGVLSELCPKTCPAVLAATVMAKLDSDARDCWQSTQLCPQHNR